MGIQNLLVLLPMPKTSSTILLLLLSLAACACSARPTGAINNANGPAPSFQFPSKNEKKSSPGVFVASNPKPPMHKTLRGVFVQNEKKSSLAGAFFGSNPKPSIPNTLESAKLESSVGVNSKLKVDTKNPEEKYELKAGQSSKVEADAASFTKISGNGFIYRELEVFYIWEPY